MQVENILEFPNVGRSDSNGPLQYHLDDNNVISLAHHGLKILGCPAGTDEFCAAHLDLLCAGIEKDLDRLQDSRTSTIFTTSAAELAQGLLLQH